MNHKTKLVQIGRKSIPVDEEIADLVYHLNKCGLKTLTSCQKDFEGNSYVVLDYKKIRLASVVNTPHPVLLIKWRKSNKKRIHSDTVLSSTSDVIQNTKQTERKGSS